MKKIGISIARDLVYKYQRVDDAYGLAVAKAGFVPVILPELLDLDKAGEMLEGLDGLILTGGSDIWPFYYGEDPRREAELFMLTRDNWEKALYEEARKRKMPVLGICRGMQLINVLHGGTMYQDIDTQFKDPIPHRPGDFRIERYHYIDCEGTLEELYGKTAIVNSFHHQGVKDLGEGLRVIARARDGMVEAIETDDGMALGVQFHPERIFPGHELPSIFAFFFGGKK